MVLALVFPLFMLPVILIFFFAAPSQMFWALVLSLPNILFRLVITLLILMRRLVKFVATNSLSWIWDQGFTYKYYSYCSILSISTIDYLVPAVFSHLFKAISFGMFCFICANKLKYFCKYLAPFVFSIQFAIT
jgi:hypothetical protein